MKSSRWLPMSILTFAVLSLYVPAAARAAEGHFARTLQVSGPVDLEVQTGSGSVEVRTGDNSTVHISGTVRSSGGWFDSSDAESKVHYIEAHPPIEQHGNLIKIGHSDDREMDHNVSISYEIVVPTETRLRSNTGSGEQSINGVRGPVDASSGSGHLRLTNIGDAVRASTGSGHITVDGVKGEVHASTGSGQIQATGVAGGLHASTGSGSVTLRQTAPGDVEVNTGSGTLELEGVHGHVRAETASGNITVEGEGRESWRLSTASGNVTVRLPSQQGFTLRAHTVSGDIHTDREMTVQGTLSKHEVEGKVGDGAFLLDVSTVSGNIRVE
jgi:putative adhesin